MRMELRRGTRHPVRLDCSVYGLSKRTASLAGQTVNMSNCGVLVSLNGAGRLTALPEVGEFAWVVLELPQVPYFRGFWLGCGCQVARVVEQTDAHLVALNVKRYRFRPAPLGESRYSLRITGYSSV